MEDNKQLAQHVDGTVQSVGQEVTNLHSELLATSRRLAELGANGYTWIENNRQHSKIALTNRCATKSLGSLVSRPEVVLFFQ